MIENKQIYKSSCENADRSVVGLSIVNYNELVGCSQQVTEIPRPEKKFVINMHTDYVNKIAPPLASESLSEEAMEESE